jgi:hypothetical protein
MSSNRPHVGVFQHREGGLYLKLHEATHSETGEIMVVYACAASGDIWVRPKAMFDEPVRFKPVPYVEDRAVRKSLKLVP